MIASRGGFRCRIQGVRAILRYCRSGWARTIRCATSGATARPSAAPLIEDLDLVIKSVTYIEPNGDIPLKERVRRANKLSCQIGHPIQETIIISLHVDGIIDFIQQRANEPL